MTIKKKKAEKNIFNYKCLSDVVQAFFRFFAFWISDNDNEVFYYDGRSYGKSERKKGEESESFWW